MMDDYKDLIVEETTSNCSGSRSENIDEEVSLEEKKEWGLLWYKFIIYVQLIFSIILGFIAMTKYFTGNIYQGNSNAVYSAYPRLRVLDIIYSGCFLGIILYTIYVRQQLAKFKKGAPKKYLILLLIPVVLYGIYGILSLAITGWYATETIIAQIISQIIGFCIMGGINYIYFKHRTHLFVN